MVACQNPYFFTTMKVIPYSYIPQSRNIHTIKMAVISNRRIPCEFTIEITFASDSMRNFPQTPV